MDILPIDQANRKLVDDFLIRQWFSLKMVVHGACIDLGTADGWYALENADVIGLVTYQICDEEMEILSLDSILENRGIGTALLNRALSKAKKDGLRRVKLITTNDNLRAMRFYQKRGFDMVKLYRNALDQSRKQKPEIPFIGMNNIPLRHELAFEYLL